jgi:hypothetical protein
MPGRCAASQIVAASIASGDIQIDCGNFQNARLLSLVINTSTLAH